MTVPFLQYLSIPVTLFDIRRLWLDENIRYSCCRSKVDTCGIRHLNLDARGKISAGLFLPFPVFLASSFIMATNNLSKGPKKHYCFTAKDQPIALVYHASGDYWEASEDLSIISNKAPSRIQQSEVDDEATNNDDTIVQTKLYDCLHP